jgi:hypothetical protein
MIDIRAAITFDEWPPRHRPMQTDRIGPDRRCASNGSDERGAHLSKIRGEEWCRLQDSNLRPHHYE